jgi:predicted transcriptional regulator
MRPSTTFLTNGPTNEPDKEEDPMDKRLLVQMTANIVAAHASANEMGQGDLLQEIDLVFRKLSDLGEGAEQVLEAGQEPEAGHPPKPAVPLAAAFGAEKVFCMVCGEGMKTLKRHLARVHGMKPGQYRRAFGIPTGTALVAKNYSDARKKMALDLNLADGLAKARAARKSKVAPVETPSPAEAPAPEVIQEDLGLADRLVKARATRMSKAAAVQTLAPAETPAPKIVPEKRAAKVKKPARSAAPVETEPPVETPVTTEVAAPTVIRRKRAATAE